VLATAVGHAGSCAEYLLHTVESLERKGIRDRRLWELQAMVAARIGDAIDAAEHHVARSLELNPYDADTIAQMGYLLVLRGRAEEGIAWMDRAVAEPTASGLVSFRPLDGSLPARRLSWRSGTSAQNPKARRLGVWRGWEHPRRWRATLLVPLTHVRGSMRFSRALIL